MKIPKPYILPLTSLFLFLSYLAGYYMCTNDTLCLSVGTRLYQLGILAFVIIPFGAMCQLVIAGVLNLMANPASKHHAIAGLIGFAILAILITVGEVGIYLDLGADSPSVG